MMMMEYLMQSALVLFVVSKLNDWRMMMYLSLSWTILWKKKFDNIFNERGKKQISIPSRCFFMYVWIGIRLSSDNRIKKRISHDVTISNCSATAG